MSVTVSFKVRKEVKEKMEKYKGIINWNEELRRFVELKIKELEAKERFEEIVRKLEEADWGVEEGFASRSVREDRDGCS
ncbi:CopG family transcriptional regulator [Ignicoccus pacificus DSM 13166]|uniref:CopG family transcriptional regulator n=1 Tax=Ignicoccus pacificus DSM 13166 TaxID=940294 RepID=A0A977PK90_9CREN|nr:CopG family transcriptional regulator [Ignicoccus pacificus DSM 13166]